MATRMLHIRDVDEDTKSWKVKLIVEEKTQRRPSKTGSTDYQRIMFADETGQKVVVSIFGSDIEYFKDSFELHKTYVITRPRVKRCDPRFCKFGYSYAWTITKKTPCELVDGEFIPPSILKVQFSSLVDLISRAGTDELLNMFYVLGVVIDKKERRTFTASNTENVVREYAIVDQEKKVVILTLWNAVAESEGPLIDRAVDCFPIIKVSNLSISKYYGGSLGSTPSTVVVLDPEIPECEILKTWRSNNLEIIVEMITKDHFLQAEPLGVFPTDKLFSIADVISEAKLDRFTVKVCVKITDLDQKYFYMACEKCYSSIDAEFNYYYTCSSCKKTTLAKPREKIHANIYDESGNLDVTVFGPHAINIMQSDSIMNMKVFDEENFVSSNEINKSLSGAMFFMKIRKKPRHFGGIKQFQYAVMNLQRIQNIAEDGKPKCSTSKGPNLSEKQSRIGTSFVNGQLKDVIKKEVAADSVIFSAV
ncbi:hypothetical protein ACJIZ3_019960 [Penstemon smallii]|uniref:Replication factor A C-terminal domain-containing protein n=1 Tax=Penstemon smallii TaxID=265156 RepID=A0ABD3T3D1_9LAMI